MERAGDEKLRRRGEKLRQAARSGEEVLIEGMALVREVGRRVLGLRLHDVQIMAAMALVQGKIVELATGEGKTLAAVPAAWLSSLCGDGVHVLTFNDYLARRDAAWMGPVHEFLGTSVGCIQDGMSSEERRQAYAQDVTYATAKQAGFDRLRDGRVLEPGDRVHRPFHHAIVDEADSLMIDEARVPLVLAGGRFPLPVDPLDLTKLARVLTAEQDYGVDENARNVLLSDQGIVKAEELLGLTNLHDEEHRNTLTALNLALHAEVLLQRDVDYIVRDGHIEVVDEFTGRVVPERRWPDGLHPALEAKEGLTVRPEGVVLASIALQHYFRLYPKLSGMSATVAVDLEELHEFYETPVVVIPPHRECVRRDDPDILFADALSKQEAIVEEIGKLHAVGRPVLVGTASVAESEKLAEALKGASVPCNVLNAKNDEAEARVIAEAGGPGAVTISTNMAGRGTDIRLGGSSEDRRVDVVSLGGLHVIGANKHESRRIDDQLRGRAGRQGDPGSSQFFVSLEDDLIERYGIAAAIEPLIEGQAPGRIESGAAVAEVARAQRIVEGQNFEIRRTLWRYTTMVERQRQVLGERREQALLEPSEIDLFSRLSPDRHADLVARLGLEETMRIEQRIALIQCDIAWSRHLARIADIRETIHMHYLASGDAFGGLWGMRKTPFDVFHEMVVDVFSETLAGLEQEMVALFESLDVTDSGVDLDRQDLKGPASTWTYIVNDTPFESTIIRLYRSMKRLRTELQS
jgi:preprotein translocase subunit SecA